MLTVKHSGAIGDIIYSLPYLKSLNKQIIFYVGEASATSGKLNDDIKPNVLEMMYHLFPKSKYMIDPNHTIFESIKILLISQDYIVSVRKLKDLNEIIDLDLDDFRKSWTTSKHIADNILDHFKTIVNWKSKPFIQNIPIIESYKNSCVCARSPRYRNINGDNLWNQIINELSSKVDNFYFVGIDKEYEDLSKIVNEIPIIKTKTNDLYDIAIIINSCKFGIYNGSSPLAIATGLNKLRYIETPSPLECKNTIYTGDSKEIYLD